MSKSLPPELTLVVITGQDMFGLKSKTILSENWKIEKNNHIEILLSLDEGFEERQLSHWKQEAIN